MHETVQFAARHGIRRGTRRLPDGWALVVWLRCGRPARKCAGSAVPVGSAGGEDGVEGVGAGAPCSGGWPRAGSGSSCGRQRRARCCREWRGWPGSGRSGTGGVLAHGGVAAEVVAVRGRGPRRSFAIRKASATRTPHELRRQQQQPVFRSPLVRWRAALKGGLRSSQWPFERTRRAPGCPPAAFFRELAGTCAFRRRRSLWSPRRPRT